MGYRGYKRRYPSSYRRPSAHRDGYGPGLVEDLIDIIVALLRAAGGLIAKGVRAIARRGRASTPRTIPEPRRSARYNESKRARHQRIEATVRAWAARPPPSKNPPIFNRRPTALPYRRKDDLLSKGERAFWEPLKAAVENRYIIQCKVRLADVVGAPDDHVDERFWFRKISAYHVDFVICDPSTTLPLLIVELDDRSHRERRKRGADQFKDDVLAAAKMPVHRVPAQQAYDVKELAMVIDRKIRAARH